MKRNKANPLRISLCALMLASATHTWANPTGGTVASGSATIISTGSTLTVTNTPNTVINWQQFSVGAGETTRFVQPSSSSAVLNRVTTSNASSLMGSLQSNGRVFLVNPNGILFGSGAQVNTASFTATTVNISDSAVLSGNTTITGAGSTVSFGELLIGNGALVIAPDRIATDGNVLIRGESVAFLGGNSAISISISSGSTIDVSGSGRLVLFTGGSEGAVSLLPGGNIRLDVGQAPVTLTRTDASTATTVRPGLERASDVVRLMDARNLYVAGTNATGIVLQGGQIAQSGSIAQSPSATQGNSPSNGQLTPVNSGNAVSVAPASIPVSAGQITVGINLQKREPMF